MKLQIIDVRKDVNVNGRVRAELTVINGVAVVSVPDLEGGAKSVVERELSSPIADRQNGGKVVTPEDGEAYLRAVQSGYSNSTIYRAVVCD